MEECPTKELDSPQYELEDAIIDYNGNNYIIKETLDTSRTKLLQVLDIKKQRKEILEEAINYVINRHEKTYNE